MIHYNSPSHRLADNIKSLQKLSQNVSSLYCRIREHITTCKSFNIVLIGNPIMNLQAEVINLNYMILNHIDTCTRYKEEISRHPIGLEKSTSIQKLISQIQEFRFQYDLVKNKSFIIPIRFTQKNILYNNFKHLDNFHFSLKLVHSKISYHSHQLNS